MLVPQDKINLWWDDYLHASKYGSYLSALVIFGKLTGINPATFGATEKAAADLGIGPGDAGRLQRVAWEQLAAEGMPLNMIPCLHANPRWRAGPASRFAGGALGSRTAPSGRRRPASARAVDRCSGQLCRPLGLARQRSAMGPTEAALRRVSARSRRAGRDVCRASKRPRGR